MAQETLTRGEFQLAMSSFVQLCVLRGWWRANAWTTKDTKVHKGTRPRRCGQEPAL